MDETWFDTYDNNYSKKFFTEVSSNKIKRITILHAEPTDNFKICYYLR